MFRDVSVIPPNDFDSVGMWESCLVSSAKDVRESMDGRMRLMPSSALKGRMSEAKNSEKDITCCFVC